MNILCLINIHKWEITKSGVFHKKWLVDVEFYRTCQRCGLEYHLQKPKKYHPTKYVWAKVNKSK